MGEFFDPRKAATAFDCAKKPSHGQPCGNCSTVPTPTESPKQRLDSTQSPLSALSPTGC
jgi:hypothetical protein